MGGEYTKTVQQYFIQIQGKPFEEVLGAKNVNKGNFPYLLATLPYKVVTKGAKYADLIDSFRHKVIFEIASSTFFGPDFSYTVLIPSLSGKRITLAYIPASSVDETLIKQYGSIETTPAYLLSLIPQLLIEGQPVATGSPVGLGQDIEFTMTFMSPNGGNQDRVVNSITAGSYLGIGLDLQYIPKTLLDKRLTQFNKAYQSQNISADDKVSETLYLLSLLYFAEVDVNVETSAVLGKVVYSRFPSEAIVGEALKVSYSFGTPLKASFGGLFIDVDRNLYAPFAKDGDKNKMVNFMLTSGFHASSMEHAIFEQTYNVGGISAVKVLQIANNKGIPIYRIDSTNLSTVLPLLQVSNEVKQEIQNHVNAGNVVTIPKQNIQYFDWVGVGYITINPNTGAGGYIISGGYAGGWWSLLLDCMESLIQLVDLLPLPMSPVVSIIADILAFLATLHDIDQANLDLISFDMATWLAWLSVVGGVALALFGSWWVVIVGMTILEVSIYVSIGLILEGGIPFIDYNPIQSCFDL